ncbi:MAG: LuxR C-terminal-related transcriptional regulator [Eubacteriales bacterium]|nr:LuxR C-terminal-related transcriptional regulator [Eubacteriales bacterium]
MQMKNQYEPLTQGQQYIDKTEALEKGIEVFPSIYIEGAAALGKTTAVRMLLAKHPEVAPAVFWMDEEMENPSGFVKSLRELKNKIAGEQLLEIKSWVIFENINRKITGEMITEIIKFLQKMPAGNRAILIGRERPAEEFLELYWKRMMEFISIETFLFSREEVFCMAERAKSRIDPGKIYAETGGWAGCVDIMLRMSARNTEWTEQELRSSYEMNTYIYNTILGVLSEEEQELMERAAFCPWINEELCREVWDLPDSVDVLERLVRKGMLVHDRNKNRWKIVPLFRANYQKDGKIHGLRQTKKFGELLSEWYERHGYIKEALGCLKESGAEEKYRRCMVKYYDKVPFLGISYKEAVGWRDSSPQMIYLRGMYAYFHQNRERFRKEIRRLEKAEGKDRCSREVYLNLMYINPEKSLDNWLTLLEEMSKDGESFRLYGMLGGSVTFLCGFRDLSGLFACTRKEENHRARIWKECLGEKEWMAYQLARIDYYMETDRLKSLKEEDKKLIDRFMGEFNAQNLAYGQLSWQIRLAGLHLLCKRQAMESELELNENIGQLEQMLCKEENVICVRNAEAVSSMYASWRKESEKLTRWLRRAEQERNIEVEEGNYYYLCCQAKGYLLLGQYEKAEKILRGIIPYLRNNRRYRYLAEILFEQALINWEAGRHSQALQSIIESFLVNGDSRYVAIYTSYGKRGKNVLDAYIEWQRANAPEGWHRKKKYNYGNVLRMPMEDYLEVILRCIRRESRNNQIFLEEMPEERLTMMETIILQDIGRGLTNAEICAELNLKLPTVKSHIYSLYKKLGVNSRVQAIIKGKEKGILD